MKTESLDKSIDVLIDTIMKSTIRAVDENRMEDSKALFDEFVVDGKEPLTDNFEWLYTYYKFDDSYQFIKLYDILRDMDMPLTEKQMSVFEKVQYAQSSSHYQDLPQ